MATANGRQRHALASLRRSPEVEPASYQSGAISYHSPSERAVTGVEYWIKSERRGGRHEGSLPNARALNRPAAPRAYSE